MTPKQEAFVREYLVDLNASAAARRAGYSAHRADAMGHENLGKPEIAAAIAAAQQERAKRVEVAADDVLREWVTIATANPAELVRYRVRACRHCHGKGHEFHWVSEAEWERAVAKAQAEFPMGAAPLPSNAGGYGYSVDLVPRKDCFVCLGDGITDVVLPDTSTLSPAAAKLYAGVKQTRDGIEVKTRDQDAALANIARHLGMFPSKVELTGKDGGPVKTDSLVQFYLPANGR